MYPEDRQATHERMPLPRAPLLHRTRALQRWRRGRGQVGRSTAKPKSMSQKEARLAESLRELRCLEQVATMREIGATPYR